MRTVAIPNLALLGAVPLLLSLLASAAMMHAGQLVFTAVERTATESRARVREQTVADLDGAEQDLHDRLAALRARLAEQRAAREQQTTLDALARDLERAAAAAAEREAALSRLKADEARLRTRTTDLAQLEARVAERRTSRGDLDAEIAKLKTEIAALEERTGTVRREIDERDNVAVQRLVPGGSGKPAIFVECDARGAWLMPERRLLGAEGAPADRDAFLAVSKATGYVVFLIRPTGIKSFGRYRAALEHYNRSATQKLEIGYEPVNEDWKLTYPGRHGGGA